MAFLLVVVAGCQEAGPVAEVFARARHPYTRALLSASPQRGRRRGASLSGEPRSPIDPASDVCRFFGRCPEGFDRCQREMPVLTGAAGHLVACHLDA